MLADGNCAPISLLQYLKDNLSVTEDAENVSIHVLTDEYVCDYERKLTSYLEYSPKQFNTEYLAKKHLILVYQGAQIVLGMTTFEYNRGMNSSRAYIQYIDTTGLFTPRHGQSHLTKSLLKSYLNYCKNVLNIESIHLLAAAKPSFLFAGSEFIEGKRALPSVKLINWWIAVLKDFTAADPKAKVFVYSPTEESEGSNRMKKRICGISGNWIYGFPYESDVPCIDQIPLFEDDPKWRHFQATIYNDSEKRSKKKVKLEMKSEDVKPCTNVKEFFESIQIRPEFRADPSAFFTLKFPKQFRDTPDHDHQNRTATKSDLATFGIKMLNTLTFENESEARFSAQKVASWMKLMAVPSFEVTKCAVVGDKENINESKLSDCIKVSNTVNSLQSLIKKKPLK